jgi:hypothetical protein
MRANEIIIGEGPCPILSLAGSVVARIEPPALGRPDDKLSEIRDSFRRVAQLPPGFAALNPGYTLHAKLVHKNAALSRNGTLFARPKFM